MQDEEFEFISYLDEINRTFSGNTIDKIEVTAPNRVLISTSQGQAVLDLEAVVEGGIVFIGVKIDIKPS